MQCDSQPITFFVANDAGHFKAEMAPVTVKTKKGW